MGTKGFFLKTVREGKKKIARGDINYNPPIQMSSDACGSPITELAAQVMIEKYLKKFQLLIDDDKVIALNFNRGDLEPILSQNNCVGVRFYLAKKLKYDFEDSSEIVSGITLIAIGVDNQGHDIATFNNNYIVEPIQRIGSVRNNGEEPDSQKGLIVEMVPPLTLRHVKNHAIHGTVDGSLESIFQKIFNIK